MLLATLHARALGPRPRSLADEIVGTLPLVRWSRAPVDEEDALALAGVAFRTYFFTPDDNHAWRETAPHPEWSDASLTIDNYGAFESLGGHTGLWRRPFVGGGAVEQWRLIQHEIEEGRMCLGLDHDGTVLALTGAVTRAGSASRLDGAGLPEGEERTVEIVQTPGAAQPTPAPFERVVVVRPEAPPAPHERQVTLLRDVLTYAWRHAGTGKEIDFERDVFVASGRRAWQVAAEFFETRADDEAPTWEYAARWLRDQERAREAAAASVLAGRLPWDAAGDGAALREAAAAWAQAAALVGEALQAWSENVPQRARVATLLRASAERDEAALSCVRRALA